MTWNRLKVHNNFRLWEHQAHESSSGYTNMRWNHGSSCLLKKLITIHNSTVLSRIFAPATKRCKIWQQLRDLEWIPFVHLLCIPSKQTVKGRSYSLSNAISRRQWWFDELMRISHKGSKNLLEAYLECDVIRLEILRTGEGISNNRHCLTTCSNEYIWMW